MKRLTRVLSLTALSAVLLTVGLTSQAMASVPAPASSGPNAASIAMQLVDPWSTGQLRQHGGGFALTYHGMRLQADPQPSSPDKSEVTVTTKETTTWYANPVWIAIGIIAAGLLLVLIVLAVRGSGSGSATVVKG